MRYSLLFFLLLLLLLWSCRTSKDKGSSSRSDILTESRASAIAQTKDSLSAYFEEHRISDTRKSLYIREYYAQADSAGNPVVKSETWIDEDATEKMDKNAGISRKTDASEVTEETARVEAETAAVASEKTTTDGRPVQGYEFVWVFIGIGAVMILNNVIRGKKN